MTLYESCFNAKLGANTKVKFRLMYETNVIDSETILINNNIKRI